MPIDSTSVLVDTVRRLLLLAPAQCDELVRLQGSFTEPKTLARDLLQRGWLTAYQINQLFLGHGGTLVLGQYVLLERIGEGGMGQVFKARHQRLERLVALKLIRPERLSSADAVARFQREARAAARLAHPNIVAVYDADEVHGTHFFVMEYVQGTDLSKLVKKNGPRPVAEACDYTRQAALGLQHAHEQGLVHRDIKPSNLFLTTKGVVKVLDMGLARLSLAEESGDGTDPMTREGTVMGTPDYMAPEQATDSHRVDIRADLYSLGCTLYCLLGGKVPFPGGTFAEKLLKHQLDAPRPLEKLRPDVPPGVAALVGRLMAKKPEQRYQTPGELALALATFCGGVPVALPVHTSIGPLSAGGQTEQNTLGTGATEGAVPVDKTVPYATVADSTVQLWPVARHFGKRAARQLGRLLAFLFVPRSRARKELVRVGASWVTLVAVVLLVWLSGGGPQDRPSPDGNGGSVLDEWIRPERTPFQKHAEKLPDEIIGTLGDEWGRSWSAIRCAAVSPDGKLAASGGDDNLIRLWDGKSLEPRGFLPGHTFAVIALAFSPDGKKLASCSEGGDWRVWLWDLETKKYDCLVGHEGVVNLLTFSNDGKKLLSAGQDQKAIQWDAATGQRLHKLGLALGTRCVALSPDGRHVLSAHTDKTLRLWDLETKREAGQFNGHTAVIDRVAFSPDGARAVSASTGDNSVHLWEVAERKQLWQSPLGHVFTALLFSTNGERIAWVHQSSAIFVMDAKTKGLLSQSSPGRVDGLAFSPDGRALVFGGGNTILRRWDLETGLQVQCPYGHTQAVSSVAFAPKGDYLLSGSHDGSVTWWELKTKSSVGGFPHGSVVYSVAISPNGKHAFAGGPVVGDKTLRLWEIESRSVTSFSAYLTQASSVAFSADSRLALSGGYGPEPEMSELRLWDVDKRVSLRAFEKVGEGINCVAFLPDGKQAVSGGVQKVIRLWDVAAGKELRSLAGHKDPVTSVACSPDGRYILSGGADSTVRLWDLKEDKLKGQVLEGSPKTSISCVVFAPDGKTMAASGADGRISLWDAATRKQVWETQLPGAVLGLSYARDSRHLATANGNGTVYILRLDAASPSAGQ